MTSLRQSARIRRLQPEGFSVAIFVLGLNAVLLPFCATPADTVLFAAQDASPAEGLVNRQPLAPVQVG